MTLNCILRPTTRFSNKKTTINDGVNSMISFINTINDLERVREDKINMASINKTKIQPYIVVQGDDITKISNFYVIVGKTIIKLTTFLSALDVCFKSFYTLNLKYPAESEVVWQCLQNYIYEINTNHDKRSSALAEFLLMLKK